MKTMNILKSSKRRLYHFCKLSSLSFHRVTRADSFLQKWFVNYVNVALVTFVSLYWPVWCSQRHWSLIMLNSRALESLERYDRRMQSGNCAITHYNNCTFVVATVTTQVQIMMTVDAFSWIPTVRNSSSTHSGMVLPCGTTFALGLRLIFPLNDGITAHMCTIPWLKGITSFQAEIDFATGSLYNIR